MYDELTKVDIKKMKAELEYRIGTVRPKILEEVKFTRSFGDLSENAEYHAAKRERGKNESRIRYLRNMFKTARIIEPESREDEVGLFDTVEYYVEEDNAVEKVRIVTSLRQNSLERLISRESPMGKALWRLVLCAGLLKLGSGMIARLEYLIPQCCLNLPTNRLQPLILPA